MDETDIGKKQLEYHVEHVMARSGFSVVSHAENADNLDFFTDKLLVKNVPYKNMYGGDSRSEFVIRWDMMHRIIRLECKWQQSSGSVDEKFVYMFGNALLVPEPEIIFLIDGEGYRPCELSWLKTEAAKAPKTIRVFSMTEFTQWARNFGSVAA
jgi:hypothetical protein